MPPAAGHVGPTEVPGLSESGALDPDRPRRHLRHTWRTGIMGRFHRSLRRRHRARPGHRRDQHQDGAASGRRDRRRAADQERRSRQGRRRGHAPGRHGQQIQPRHHPGPARRALHPARTARCRAQVAGDDDRPARCRQGSRDRSPRGCVPGLTNLSVQCPARAPERRSIHPVATARAAQRAGDRSHLGA